jgi:hypothetical protein
MLYENYDGKGSTEKENSSVVNIEELGVKNN